MTNLQTQKNNHNTYGGAIYESDFYTTFEGSRDIAGRIASDHRFDEACRKNIEGRNGRRQHGV